MENNAAQNIEQSEAGEHQRGRQQTKSKVVYCCHGHTSQQCRNAPHGRNDREHGKEHHVAVQLPRMARKCRGKGHTLTDQNDGQNDRLGLLGHTTRRVRNGQQGQGRDQLSDKVATDEKCRERRDRRHAHRDLAGQCDRARLRGSDVFSTH